MGETPYTTDEAKSQTLSSAGEALYWNLSPKIIWINKGSIGKEMGTGVCIKIGIHYFIATAAHVLKPKGKNHVLSKPPFKEIDPFPISPIHVGTDENVDVAFLEIEESIALELQTEFLELKDLLVQTGPLDDLVFMAGFPTEYTRLRNQANQVHIDPLFFLGIPINPTGNPAGVENLEYPHRLANAEDHIIVHWSQEQDTDGSIIDYDSKVSYDLGRTKMPEPYGISGGGIWAMDIIKAEGIWQSDQAKLVAIQTRWNEKKRYVKGTRIHHWLALIRENYDDLQDCITAVVQNA